LPGFIFRLQQDVDRHGYEGLSMNMQRIDVVDPDELYAGPGLDCSKDQVRHEVSVRTPSPEGDPRVLVRTFFGARLEAADEVRWPGYPDARAEKVIVQRDGQTVASVEYGFDDSGGVIFEDIALCSDAFRGDDGAEE
ncbi:MAG: hypothetical protein QOH90_448, partial [Actinomycetota bacterium]|nr:hypothetical protein [Actinomycetota bacterium]